MIYFIRNTLSGDIKIGYSAVSPIVRLSQMCTGNLHLELAAVFQGNLKDESDLKKQFAQHRIDREWFRYEGKLARLLEVFKKECGTFDNCYDRIRMDIHHIGSTKCPTDQQIAVMT